MSSPKKLRYAKKRSTGSGKLCPPGKIKKKVCQIRCIKQSTFREEVSKKLKNAKRSSRKSSSRKKSSSSVYYTPKEYSSNYVRLTKQQQRVSPILANYLSEIRTGIKLKPKSPKRSSPNFLKSIRAGIKLKPVKKSSPKKTFLQQIKSGIKLNPVKKSPKKKDLTPPLLKAIKGGVKLKPVKKGSPKKKTSTPKTLEDLLKKSMQQMRKKVSTTSTNTSRNSSSEWN